LLKKCCSLPVSHPEDDELKSSQNAAEQPPDEGVDGGVDAGCVAGAVAGPDGGDVLGAAL
jgi:hypothetical protein